MNDKDYKLYKESVKCKIDDSISNEDLKQFIIQSIRPAVGIIPKSFYRYRKFSFYVDSEIREGYTYLSRPTKFDDIFDSKYMMVSKNEKDELYRFLFSAKGIDIDEVTEVLINKRNTLYDNRLRVGCFTQKNTNIPMWYYYADQHRGVCIKYDFSDLSLLDKEECIFLPVVYPKDEELDEYYLFTKEDCDACAIRNALIKNRDWSFEKEWRIIKLTNNEEGIKIPMAISEIYLGIDADVNTKNSVMAAASVKKIKVFQMTMTHKGLKPKRCL